MSFTDTVKAELYATEEKKNCCRRATLLGMLALRGECREGDVSLSVSGAQMREFAARLIEEQYHTAPVFHPHQGRRAVGELVFSSKAARAAFSAFSEVDVPFSFEKCPRCRRALLLGMFLAGGRATSPQKDYHLELSCGERRAFAEAVLAAFDLYPRRLDRRGEHLLYLRNSSAIEDMLAHLGATQSVFRMMDSKIERGMRNDANRLANCDANNIGKIIAAASRQSELIRRLTEEGKLGMLAPELEYTARLRLLHADLSIAQLAALHDPPLTKSGLNHRLTKLTAAAEGLLAKKNKEV